MSKSLLVTVGVVLATTTAVISPTLTAAQTQQTATTIQQSIAPIDIPVTTVVTGQVGSMHELATKTVPNGEYTVKVVAKNQGSVHPNNDILVTSGTGVVTVADVEREAFTEQAGDGTLVVTDGKVVVSLKLGQDKVFSGGMIVTLTAKPVVPPVTPEEPKPEPPRVLPAAIPSTGAEVIGSLIGAGSLTYATRLYVASRRVSRR